MKNLWNHFAYRVVEYWHFINVWIRSKFSIMWAIRYQGKKIDKLERKLGFKD